MAGLGQSSNPCSVLNSYHAGCEYVLLEEKGPPHSKQYVYSVSILGFEYKGSAGSKKRAKAAAAAAALKKLYQINLGLNMEDSSPSVSLGETQEKPAVEPSECHNVHCFMLV